MRRKITIKSVSLALILLFCVFLLTSCNNIQAIQSNTQNNICTLTTGQEACNSQLIGCQWIINNETVAGKCVPK